MAFDSTANLLYTISANSDDAENNIKRFRAILSKDLDGIGAEVEHWATEVFGSLASVQGVVVAGTAAVAAGALALGAVALESANKYEELVSEIGRGTRMTGIAAEQMSVLHYAANATSTGYDSLVRGVGRFQAEVVKANATEEDRIKLAAKLGVSTAEVAAGEKNIIPLLEATMDRFRGLASGTERAALARDLFSRNGVELLGFLRLGSEGMRKMAEEAERLGLIITEKDIVAVKEHKAAMRELKEEFEAFAVALGRQVVPLLEGFTVMMIGLVETVKQGGLTSGTFMAMWIANAEMAAKRIQDLVHSMGMVGDQDLAPHEKAVKKVTDSYYGLSSVMEQIKTKMAATGPEEGRVVEELSRLSLEAEKARVQYQKLKDEGKLTAEDAAREAKALAALPQAIAMLGVELMKQVGEKQRLAVEQSGDDLRARITAQQQKTSAQQDAAWSDEIAKLRVQLEKKKELNADNLALLAVLEKAGHEKIHREQLDAFEQELVGLQGHMVQLVTASMTTYERLEFQYDQDLAKYSEVEMEKSIVAAGGERYRAEIEAQFALVRQALLQKYGTDLVALQNSQGWQGVFGAKFGALLKGDEAAMREWATANNQSILLVRYSLEMLEQVGKQAFDQLAQGMGSNIAHAIVYQESIGKAMRAALASTLESIAGECIAYAIYATALGFLRLAEHDGPGAAAAFTAAAEFGAAGGVAALMGRAIAPAQDKAGASAGTPAGSGGGTAASGGSTGSVAQQQGTQVHVVINGHVIGVSGVQELTAMINDAVLNKDVQLTATNTKTTTVVTR